jgi:ankyrin repeat protein
MGSSKHSGGCVLKFLVLAGIVGLLAAIAIPDFLKFSYRIPTRVKWQFKSALKSGNQEKAAALIKQHPRLLEYWDQTRRNPLHYVAEHGEVEMARFLIVQGAVINQRDEKGETARDLAVARKNQPVADLLAAAESLAQAVKDADVVLAEKILTAEPDLAHARYAADASEYSPRFSLSLMDLAAQAGRMNSAEFLLKYEFDLNSSLALAAGNGQSAMVRFLLEKGAQDDYGWALEKGVRGGDLKTCEALLDHSAQLRDNGVHELQIAVNAKNAPLIELLMKHGAELYTVNQSKDTILHQAAAENNVDLVTALLNSGVDPNGRNLQGQTPLHRAAVFASYDAAVRLVAAGADPVAQDNQGETPLSLLTPSELGKGEQKVELIFFLLRKGASVNTRNADGFSLVHWGAGRLHQYQCVFLSLGADVNAQDKFGRAPLHRAVSSVGENVQVLLMHGADVNIRDDHGRTPLHYAIDPYYDPFYFDMMFEYGMMINPMDSSGRTPFKLAIELDHKPAALWLKNHGGYVMPPSWWSSVSQAAQAGSDQDLAELLNQAPAPVSGKPAETILHWDAVEGPADVAEVLIGRGYEVDQPGYMGMTPLHQAADWGNVEVARVLLEHGADPNREAQFHRTSLHYAARGNHFEVARLLLDHGAKINATDISGRTPLHYAADAQHLETTRLLMERGADWTAKDRDGHSAYYSPDPPPVTKPWTNFPPKPYQRYYPMDHDPCLPAPPRPPNPPEPPPGSGPAGCHK